MGLWSSQSRSPGAHPLFTRATESRQHTVCNVQSYDEAQIFLASLAQPGLLQVDHHVNQTLDFLIYQRLFKKVNSRLFRATRIVTHGLTLLVIAYYVPAFFVSIFQCSPVSKSWRSKTSGTCIDLTKFRFYNAAFNIITSVLIIATRLPALSTVRRSRPEISELMVLILLGMV